MKKFRGLSTYYITWISILVLIPIFLMLVMSFLEMQRFDFSNASFTLANFEKVFNQTYFSALLKSFKLGFYATIGCLLIGYPVAYIVSNLKTKNKFSILIIFILPMWTNLLLRVETINRLLKDEGILKDLFGFSIDLSGTEFAIVLTMILIYLPFMIFPIFTVLEKTDKHLLEAAMDLGAKKWQTFFKVTLPLSMKGVSSGITMVFLPAAMGFAIPQIVSNGKIQLIGNLIERHFKGVLGNYNLGSLTALTLIIFIIGALFIMNKIDKEGELLI